MPAAAFHTMLALPVQGVPTRCEDSSQERSPWAPQLAWTRQMKARPRHSAEAAPQGPCSPQTRHPQVLGWPVSVKYPAQTPSVMSTHSVAVTDGDTQGVALCGAVDLGAPPPVSDAPLTCP